jgi:DNA-binding response OmpR family regulator
MGFARRKLVENSSGARPLSIIVAEDDDLLRARLRTILLALDARVQEAVDGWEVMSLLLSAADPIDLVISDLRLLRSTGLEALVSARAAGIEVPFLFVVPSGGLALHPAAARLGAAFLEKPVIASELLSQVRLMCGVAGAAICSGPGAA